VRADGPTNSTSCLAFSADGASLVCGEDGGTVRVWDVAAGTERSGRRLQKGFGGYAGFGAVLVTPRGRILATPNDTPHARAPMTRAPIVWDVRTGKAVLAIKPFADDGNSRYRFPVGLSPDGKTAAIGVKNEVVLLEVAAGRERSRLKANDAGLFGALFSADGRRLATSSSSANRDPVLRIWDVTSGKELSSITDRSLNRIALSPDGKVVASAGSSSVIVFWDAGTGRNLRQTPGGVFNALAFSEDGTVLASGESGGRIRLWDVATAGELLTLNGHRGGVRALAFAGGRLASAGFDTTVLVWDLARAAGDNKAARAALQRLETRR
jgi:WD40 repeat protein